jgi:hypothetical protein
MAVIWVKIANFSKKFHLLIVTKISFETTLVDFILLNVIRENLAEAEWWSGANPATSNYIQRQRCKTLQRNR